MLDELDFRRINKVEFNYPYKFSIITAVYNVEQFLEEAIDSILNQTLSFERYVQLILIDDGSTDRSGEICDSYKEKYPENIVVIHKENGGVSSARNEGLKLVEGRYVNCLDADDKLSPNTLKNVYEFMVENDEYIDLAAIPVNFFDGKTGPHPLNIRHAKGSRIIWLRNEYQYPLLSSSCTFIKLNAARKFFFDENLSLAEDAKYIQQILLDKMCYGVVENASYEYRRRTGGEQSAIQGSVQKTAFYLNHTEFFELWTIQYCKNKLGYVPYFIQYSLMYDLQWRFLLSEIPEGVLTSEEERKFRTNLYNILQNIDDKIILDQRNIFIEQKFYALMTKYNKAPDVTFLRNNAFCHYQNTVLFWYSNNLTKIDFLDIQQGTLVVEGYHLVIGYNDKDDVKTFLSLNDNYVLCDNSPRELEKFSLNDRIYKGFGFSLRVNLPTERRVQVQFYIQLNGALIQRTNIYYGKFCPVNLEFKNSYLYNKQKILICKKDSLIIERCGPKKRLEKEIKLLSEIKKSKKIGSKKALITRTAAHFLKPFLRKEVWLISDRVTHAGDNGEALFKYIQQNPIRNVKALFAINKNSADYSKMKAIGKVIPLGGWQYKMYLLVGAKIVSSQGEDYIFRPFLGIPNYYSDLTYSTKFIFLQHGIIKDDLSRWLNKYNKNIDMFVTSTSAEYNSVLSYPYFYNDKIVKLTGLPRYDFLYHDEKKYITIMPTWRAYLVSDINPHTGERTASPAFKNSQYYQMYQMLFNDQNLLEKAQEHGYKIRYVAHPNMECTRSLFEMSSDIELVSTTEEYKKIFAESNLIITDYSSVAFDFAYLRKPVIYFQADKDEFFSGNHTYDKGYFEYESDGFGEVLYTEQDLSEKIIEYMSNGCEVKQMYRERIEHTFPFSDQQNCQRVCAEILKL